jgi:hypothetical protein
MMMRLLPFPTPSVTCNNIAMLTQAWDTYSFGVLVAVLFNRCGDPFPSLDERGVMVKVCTGCALKLARCRCGWHCSMPVGPASSGRPMRF